MRICSIRYWWGNITHKSVGVVRSNDKNGNEVILDFPEQKGWRGLVSEMELVPGIHPKHR
jgi:E3 ubiquitin-protein ligase HERC2